MESTLLEDLFTLVCVLGIGLIVIGLMELSEYLGQIWYDLFRRDR